MITHIDEFEESCESFGLKSLDYKTMNGFIMSCNSYVINVLVCAFG